MKIKMFYTSRSCTTTVSRKQEKCFFAVHKLAKKVIQLKLTDENARTQHSEPVRET